jgi:hypothetical protein
MGIWFPPEADPPKAEMGIWLIVYDLNPCLIGPDSPRDRDPWLEFPDLAGSPRSNVSAW